ncbi:mandelate racemase/muconate lactonizing enzyme family protein [Phytohabitans kaempferiae]|uniref:Mandelate racemase/muconate lactonizing enzyme family protein n=1 Tax=Phytohabitans kaempferiae TaxID=1620943 RepID=A0ABV6M5U5_9ACTN
MKIVDVKATVVGTPWRELTFIELVADNGLRGLGEARMLNKTDTLLACVNELSRRYVIGSDPFDVERLAWRFAWEEYGRAGEVTQTALATIDLACHDLVAQQLGVPIYQLLGGEFRSRVPAYANGWYQGEREPDSIAAKAAQVIARGYRALKIDPFGAATAELPAVQLRLACDILAAVRDTVGPDVDLMVEMHGRFTAASAARVAKAIEPYAPAWIEEPVPPSDMVGLRQLRAATSVPIATGERVHTVAEFRELLEHGLVDIVQADLTHIGGFTGLRKLAGWAAAYNVLIAPHNVCGPVGTMANLHLAAATPNYKVLEHFNDFADPWVAGLVSAAPTVDAADGHFAIPTAPGLGIRLDHEACARYPRTNAHFNLVRDGWERRNPAVSAQV